MMYDEEPSTPTTPPPPQSLTFIEGVKDIVDRYDVFIIDMWGVMHDGTTPYEGVIDTIQQLVRKNNNSENNIGIEKKKKLIILSNSGKRLNMSKKSLMKLGFDPENDFFQIITSGDVGHRMLSGENSSTLLCSTWDLLDKHCNSTNNGSKIERKNVFVFGSGDSDEEYVASCGWTLCTNIEKANLILARGAFTIYSDNGNGNAEDVTVISKHQDESLYNTVLEATFEKASKLQIPMLITNPDKVRPTEGLPPMPGALGDAYEKYLGPIASTSSGRKDSFCHPLVKRIGKPFTEVYDIALASCGSDRSRVIMVGDSLETDITGATRSNIDTLWVVNNGVHAPSVKELMNQQNGAEYETCVKSVLDGFNDKMNYTGNKRLHPTFVAKHFQW
eukprot:CAMPEP_0203666662 /NCGR_PEP_ID=MMETSP0090-20130426/3665_1 /ASSEMBLY_ACC=CAM_ASM_001088 /TAXON_ID=426623 /ORGANISM="Chaetoceros affinis, Strain CCMP159" /LENGTH=388 /DNA_ID=CAMNT_0050530613 /DNA_START=6 /DNA_END=1172 /DNA_ORIENTATION=-